MREDEMFVVEFFSRRMCFLKGKEEGLKTFRK